MTVAKCKGGEADRKKIEKLEREVPELRKAVRSRSPLQPALRTKAYGRGGLFKMFWRAAVQAQDGYTGSQCDLEEDERRREI